MLTTCDKCGNQVPGYHAKASPHRRSPVLHAKKGAKLCPGSCLAVGMPDRYERRKEHKTKNAPLSMAVAA